MSAVAPMPHVAHRAASHLPARREDGRPQRGVGVPSLGTMMTFGSPTRSILTSTSRVVVVTFGAGVGSVVVMIGVTVLGCAGAPCTGAPGAAASPTAGAEDAGTMGAACGTTAGASNVAGPSTASIDSSTTAG